MKHILTYALLFILISSTCYATKKPTYMWRALQKGLSYAKIFHNSGTQDAPRLTTLHAFRIDPKNFRIDVITAKKNKKYGEPISDMAKSSRALIGINGGFFTPEHKSIGLLIKSGKKINPMHYTSWWSVFGIRGDTPIILPQWQVKSARGFKMALQAGPRLVVNGRVSKLKNSKKAARSAIGITQAGNVILVITESAGIAMHDMAEIMRRSRFINGLGCPNAMGLDGGRSSQLYSRVGQFNLSVDGFSRVPNGIGVFRK